MALPAPSPNIGPPRQAQPSEPDQPKGNPYFPTGPEPLLFEEFAGINTQMPRSGVPDQQMAWCDGWMPIAKRNLRTLYGVGVATYTATGGLAVKFFFNVGAYIIVFLSDGSIQQVNAASGSTVQIAPAGTILNPAVNQVGVTLYNDQYLIIVANQVNGYWLWDGVVLYQAGQLSPIVTLTNVGSGYVSVPFVTVTGGSGTGATLAAQIANGEVTNVTVTNPGSNYLPGQTVTLVFSGGTQAGSGGSLTAVLSSTGSGSGATFTIRLNHINAEFDSVASVTVTNGGSGYSQFTTLTVNYSPTFGGTTPASIQPVISGGVITGVTILNAGLYNNGEFTPTVSVSATDHGAFTVTSVTINNGGSGYSPSVTAVCSGGGSPVQQAVLQLVLTAGVITTVTVASGGLYGSNTPPTVTVSDATVVAAGTVELMPFGIQGTAVETYAGHVWVINGTEVNATAPGSPDDFATSNGGVSFTSNNSYSALVNTNGFLYLIGDSATDYISGVTSTGAGPVTTTYTFLNADPEVGSPYPASVLTFGNYILLGNSVGVYFLAGSTFTKISDDLDGSGLLHGLWGSVLNFGGNQLSASKANIFGKKVWMILATVVDPISGLQVNKLFMTDTKKWWSSQQDVTLIYISASEFNSVLTAYGTDGTSIYPLFQQPSAGFTKTFQSRLWDAPGGYTHTKAAVRLFGVAYYYHVNSVVPGLAINITVDNETNQSSASLALQSNVVVWVNNNGVVVTWTNNSATIATWHNLGYSVLPPEAVGQQGVFTGITGSTTVPDVSLISLALQDEVVSYRG